VHDRASGVTERVSVGSAGQEGNDAASGQPQISGDGRFVAFASWASNLVAGDLNGGADVFVRDRLLAQTIRVSVDSSGEEQAFSQYVYANAISNDGRYVLFSSSASNLVADDTNGQDDVFLHDMQTGVTSRVSLGNSSVEGNARSAAGAISDDGRFIAFESDASNLVSNDTNNANDVFVHDTLTATTTRASVDSSGLQGDGPSAWPTISSDGRYVAFVSSATQLVPDDLNSDWDVFVHDRLTAQTLRVSVDSSGNGGDASGWGSAPAAISPNGRYVAFSSGASNLVPNDTNAASDIFVHDITTGATERVSLTSTQSQANNVSLHPSISGDGSVVAFHSDATNLVPNDTNGFREVFVHDSGMEALPTPTPTPSPVAVGGIVELRANRNAQRDEPKSDSSLPLPASVAIGLLVMGVGGLYVVKMRRG